MLGIVEENIPKVSTSSKKANLEQNVVDMLELVPLLSIWRFCSCSDQFMDGYLKRLNGVQAAYVSKVYKKSQRRC